MISLLLQNDEYRVDYNNIKGGNVDISPGLSECYMSKDILKCWHTLKE